MSEPSEWLIWHRYHSFPLLESLALTHSLSHSNHARIFCLWFYIRLFAYISALLFVLALQVKHSPDKFFFTVETTGALKPVDVVRDAIRQLAEKIRHLKVKTIKLESM